MSSREQDSSTAEKRGERDYDRSGILRSRPITSRLASDELDRFLQVATGFRKGAALGVHPGNFLNGGDVPLSALLDDGSELFFSWRFSKKV
jgi:hypothetical protein